MAISKDKALWSSSGFQSRTSAERAAYRAALKTKKAAFYATPEAKAAQERIAAAHAKWLADGMPDKTG
jgi:hypothetical protein